jgi:WD40 repeat protein
MMKSRFVSVLILFFLCMMMVPCTAIQPAWTYTEDQAKIEDLVVAPDGSAVVAGAGKVLLLSRNGTVLAKEPFGEIITQSRDGSTIISGYSSVVSTTVYLFKKITDINGNPSLQKQWEATQPNRVSSFAVSEMGDDVAFTNGGTGIYVYDGKNGDRTGYSDEYSSLIAMSAKGNIIAGISTDQGMKVYTSRGGLYQKYDITLAGQPKSFLMNDEGQVVVFDAGPQIIAFNVSNGSEIWKKRSSGDVNMLAMTPPGNLIAAGTENGAIELYDANGTLKWQYNTTSGEGSGHAIKAVALTREGSKIVAGSVDGNIFFLDSAGNLLWTYNTGNAPILKVAIAADGSLAASASENTIYSFDTRQQGTSLGGAVTSSTLPSRTFPSGISSTTIPDTSDTPDLIRTTPRSAAPDTLTVTQTEYSVIRKATQSPLEGMTAIAALAVVLFLFVARKNN